MSSSIHPQTPKLTPSFCLTPTLVSTFFSRSRALTDDPISQNLSALSNPSRNAFKLSPMRTPSTSRLPNSACGQFIAGTLLPTWAEREEVFTYCEEVARNPTLKEGGSGIRDEAEAQARVEAMRERAEWQYGQAPLDQSFSGSTDEEPDERLDPYSARVEKPETRQELLQRVLKREREVEDIIRSRTWGVIHDRCIGVDGGWQEVMMSWNRSGTT